MCSVWYYNQDTANPLSKPTIILENAFIKDGLQYVYM